MRHENLRPLILAGQAFPIAPPTDCATLTEVERFEAIIHALQQLEGKKFYLFHDLEKIKDEQVLRKFKVTKGDIFFTMAEAIGLRVQTLGEVMDAAPLTKAEVHLFGCDCIHDDPHVDAGVIALMMMAFKMHHCHKS